MGFTNPLSRLPSAKALPLSHYKENCRCFKNNIRSILSYGNYLNLVQINSPCRPSVAVNSNLKYKIASGVNISSNLISRKITTSSIASFHISNIADFITCIAQ